MGGLGLFAGILAGALVLSGIFMTTFFSFRRGNTSTTTFAETTTSIETTTTFYDEYYDVGNSGSGATESSSYYDIYTTSGSSGSGTAAVDYFYDTYDKTGTSRSGSENAAAKTTTSSFYNKLIMTTKDAGTTESEKTIPASSSKTTTLTTSTSTTPISETSTSSTTTSTSTMSISTNTNPAESTETHTTTTNEDDVIETTKSFKTPTTKPQTTATNGQDMIKSEQTTESAITMKKEFTPCNYFYNSTLCYWGDLRYTWDTSYAEALQICKAKNSEIAQIYNKDIYEGVMDYIRTEMPKTYTRVWIGLTAEKFGTADLYTRWYPGSFRSRSKDATNVILDVDQDPNFYYQGMRKASPTSEFPGVVCQVKTDP